MSTRPPRVTLIDTAAPLVAAWREAFDDVDGVEVIHGDYFSHPADAMVSPANSFGIMDGGLDRAIRDTLGFAVERRAQRAILDHAHGELPVGQALIVASDEPRWPWLVVAPTMRVPESVATTLNAYLAFRAALLAVTRHAPGEGAPITSMVCCGLGTGIGGLEPRRCAAQMRVAYRHATTPPRIPSFQQIHEVHQAMKRA